MLETKELLRLFLEEVKTDLIAEQRSQGKDASGNSVRSYEVKSQGNDIYAVGQLLGANYFDFIEKGRGPGKFPPLAKIEQWIRDRELEVDEKRIKSFAFLVARKIAQEGSQQYKKGPAELLRSATERRLKAFQDSVLTEANRKFGDEIYFAFQ